MPASSQIFLCFYPEIFLNNNQEGGIIVYDCEKHLISTVVHKLHLKYSTVSSDLNYVRDDFS